MEQLGDHFRFYESGDGVASSAHAPAGGFPRGAGKIRGQSVNLGNFADGGSNVQASTAFHDLLNEDRLTFKN